MTKKQIGKLLGRPQQRVSYQLYTGTGTGTGKIVAQLNGGEFTEAEV